MLAVKYLLCALLVGSVLLAAQAKIEDNAFLAKCRCHDMPPSKPSCDFSKLSKAKLRKLVDRLLSSQIVCVQADGILLPTFTSALNPLSAAQQRFSVSAVVGQSGKIVFADDKEENEENVEERESEKKAVSDKKKNTPTDTDTDKKGKEKKPVKKNNKKKDDDDNDEDEEEEDDEEDKKKAAEKAKNKQKSSADNAKKQTKSTPVKTTAAAEDKDKNSVVSGKDSSSNNNSGKNKLVPRRSFSPTPPKSCSLDGFHCTTDNGLELLFPTPVLIQELITDAHSQQMNAELKDLMLELEEDDEGCKFNLHGGYRSQDGFLSRPDRSVQWLRNQIIPRVQHLLNIANASQISFTVDGWGAVLRGGHTQNAHVHPGSIYAGVYYVSAPKEMSTQPSTQSKGCLSFYDPRNGVSMAQVVRGKNVYGDAIEICPGEKGGLLVIFPSWLMHQVNTLPEKVTGPRIGISFNAVYKPV